MEVKNHRIDSIWYKSTSNLSSGAITPRFIVNHYTAGWSGTGARNWLLGAAGGTSNQGSSAHMVIDLDGAAWQIAAFNRRAWHAGPSRYGNIADLNSHAIGLEFVNPGFMKPTGDGAWVDDAGNRRTEDQLNDHGGFILAKHPIVGSGTYAWPVYTEAQLATGRAITLAIINKYDIRDIITHEEIDNRGWKTDPGPAFPQQSFKDMLGEESNVAPNGGDHIVTASRLNLRGHPSTDAERIVPPESLPKGTTVSVENRLGDWAFITVVNVPAPEDGLVPGLNGWVHGGYIAKIF